MSNKTDAAAPAAVPEPAPAREKPAKRIPAAPAVGGSRTAAQLESFARKAAGEPVAEQDLAPCDRPKPAKAKAKPRA